jgi:hypothetical protein
MIIIPEIWTVLILVPRTGTGSLRRAVAARYPSSMLVYRHMEADGVPLGYDRWRKVGVVRNPIARLWSLYKFLANFDGPHDPAYIDRMRESVAHPFPDWIVENETVFTSPYDRAGLGRYFPHYTVRHSLPETQKSQFLYLRPDLGTEVWQYDSLPLLWANLGLARQCAAEDRHNCTAQAEMPVLHPSAQSHIERFFAWDLAAIQAVRAA